MPSGPEVNDRRRAGGPEGYIKIDGDSTRLDGTACDDEACLDVNTLCDGVRDAVATDLVATTTERCSCDAKS